MQLLDAHNIRRSASGSAVDGGASHVACIGNVRQSGDVSLNTGIKNRINEFLLVLVLSTV